MPAFSIGVAVSLFCNIDNGEEPKISAEGMCLVLGRWEMWLDFGGTFIGDCGRVEMPGMCFWLSD